MAELERMTKEQITDMFALETKDREQHKLSEKNIDPIKRFINEGLEPGGFLFMVLCNDLAGACKHADVYNRRKLFEYIEFLSNHAPEICWGSKAKVNNWLLSFQLPKEGDHDSIEN